MFYDILVGFLVVYYATVFGYSEARANDLGNWYWIANAIALLVAGVLSDRLLVRKPFMIVGALISAIGVALFASAATSPDTSCNTFVVYLVIIAVGTGIVFAAWMAAFTETVLSEIATKFGISHTAALGRPAALGQVPVADVQLLQANGPKVQAAGDQLERSSSTSGWCSASWNSSRPAAADRGRLADGPAGRPQPAAPTSGATGRARTWLNARESSERGSSTAVVARQATNRSGRTRIAPPLPI